VSGDRKAIIIFVPHPQLKDYHKIQTKLVRELEKKFRLAMILTACAPAVSFPLASALFILIFYCLTSFPPTAADTC
jgi:uncharacterized protein YqhQ